MRRVPCLSLESISRGFILLTVSVALITIGLIAVSMQSIGNTTARTLTGKHALEKARMAAEAGLAHGIRNIMAPSKSTPANICNKDYTVDYVTGVGQTWLTHTFASGSSYTVSLGFDSTINDEPGELAIKSTGTADGVTVTLAQGFSSLKYRNAGKSQGCNSSDPFLCTRFPTKDRNAYSWGGGGDGDNKTLSIDGGSTTPKVMAAVDFGIHSIKDQFNGWRVLHVRNGFYVTASGTSSGNVRFYSLKSSASSDWPENSVSYDDMNSMKVNTPTAQWNYRDGRGMKWVTVTRLFQYWISPATGEAYRGLLYYPSSNIDWLYFSSKDEDITPSIRGERPRLDLRPRLEIFYIPLGSC